MGMLRLTPETRVPMCCTASEYTVSMYAKWLIALLCLSLGATDVVKEADPKVLTAIVSFLASDALEGRDTPSTGLTVAGEYIASEFRRSGIRPVVDGTYFQDAHAVVRRVVREGFELSFRDGEKTLNVGLEKALWNAGPKLELTNAAVRKLAFADLKDFSAASVEPVVLLSGPVTGAGGALQLINGLAAKGAKLIVLLGIPAPLAQVGLEFDGKSDSGPVLFRTTEGGVEEFLKAAGPLTATVKLAEASRKAETVRNVVGLLPGSDPKLRDEYLVVSAHYDHLGTRAHEAGDNIYNGANDDASGTASMIETAHLLAGMKPRRSILFVAFFGEEKGLLGSKYFAEHPVVPLWRIVADLNLEQTGRTDSSEGPNIGMANLTGYDFTDIHSYLEAAGKSTGLKIVKNERLSDPYFMASDNAALAAAGIPATTLSVTYAYPDYHQRGDHWDKIDYLNMAKVTQTVAQGVLLMADAPEPMRWNPDSDRVKGYRLAAEKLRQMK